MVSNFGSLIYCLTKIQLIMKKLFAFLLLGIIAFGCKSSKSTVASSTNPSNTVAKQLYIDVHHLGAGNVTKEAVAEAHLKDLNVEGKYGVNFIEYWVDESNGTVYCLSESPNEESITKTHGEAHGLLPDDIFIVNGGKEAISSGKSKLYLDIHNLGAGNVTKEAVAEAHLKDLNVEGQYGVNFINYWVDEANGNVFCLSESPSADAVKETHAHAHGLIPNKIVEVKIGK